MNRFLKRLYPRHDGDYRYAAIVGIPCGSAVVLTNSWIPLILAVLIIVMVEVHREFIAK